LFSTPVVGDTLTTNVFNGQVSVPPTVTWRNATYYTVGGLFGMSTNGITSLSKGIQRAEALKCAAKILNQEPFFPNTTILWYLQDDQNTASVGLTQTLAFIENGLTAVIGAGPSSVSEPVARLLGGFLIPMVSYASSLASLDERTLYPSFFRTVASDTAQIETMIHRPGLQMDFNCCCWVRR